MQIFQNYFEKPEIPTKCSVNQHLHILKHELNHTTPFWIFGFNIYQQEFKLFNTFANIVEFRSITLLSSEGEKTAVANEDMN